MDMIHVRGLQISPRNRRKNAQELTKAARIVSYIHLIKKNFSYEPLSPESIRFG